MFIIPIICFIISIIAYFKGKYEWVLIFITFFITNGYLFIPTESFLIKPYDYALILLLIISWHEYRRNKHYFATKTDWMAKLIILLLCYQTFEFIYTILSGAETFLFAFKLYRLNIFYLMFFFLRKIPYKDIKRFVDINMYLSITQGIFFYLQPLGVTGILTGRIDEAIYGNQLTRYVNHPLWAQFYFFYGLLSNKSWVKKCCISIFFGYMFILGMGRGMIIMSAVAFVSYALLMQKAKYYSLLVVGVIVMYLVALPMFAYRDLEGGTESSSTLGDIENVLTSKDLTQTENSGGTFTFRIAMLVERWNYLWDNPEYLLIGVGDIHEESPKCYNRFNFTIGTRNDGFRWGRCMLDSGDITWVPLLIRYGLIGISLFASILLLWLKRSIKETVFMNSTICKITALISISTIIGSFSNMVFESYFSLFLLLFCITVPQTFKNYAEREK